MRGECDEKTYTYLGSREVYTVDPVGIEAGTVRFSTAILDRAVVDAIKLDAMKQVPGN